MDNTEITMKTTYPGEKIEILNQMSYSSKREHSVLATGKYKGIPWRILSLGTHPCCYIGVPLDCPLADMLYDGIDIEVHGGLTYGAPGSDIHLPQGNYWFGWDYAHAGDYTGYSGFNDQRRWSVMELIKGVYDAIDQLRKKYSKKLIGKKL